MKKAIEWAQEFGITLPTEIKVRISERIQADALLHAAEVAEGAVQRYKSAAADGMCFEIKADRETIAALLRSEAQKLVAKGEKKEGCA